MKNKKTPQTFSCFSACNCNKQGGKNPTKPLKGLSDLNRAIRPCSCLGAAAFFERLRGLQAGWAQKGEEAKADTAVLLCWSPGDPHLSPALHPLHGWNQSGAPSPQHHRLFLALVFSFPRSFIGLLLGSTPPSPRGKRHKQNRSLPEGRLCPGRRSSLCLSSSLSPAPWQVMG